ncbi:hypothetical protein Pfo_011342 [Paulownia fortunei]|nr:hypothetical protein Pfo_011342 [Paulownia fortunei]
MLFICINKVNELLSQNNVITDKSALNKTTLKWSIEISEEISQPVAEDFSDDLISNVEETNQSVITPSVRVFPFGDENQSCGSETVGHGITREEVMYCINDIQLNNIQQC